MAKHLVIPANTFVERGRLPKGWTYGPFWCNQRELGWWVVRDSDGLPVKIVDWPGTPLSIRRSLMIASKRGLLPKVEEE